MIYQQNLLTILLTGASGFLGSHLMTELMTNPEVSLRVSARSNLDKISDERLTVLPPADLSNDIDWSTALNGCDVVIHTAARVHVMKEKSLNPLDEYRRINVKGTLKLAHQAIKAGVKRFIYISSIKVNGEITKKQQQFRADDPPQPIDDYGISKLEAEQELLKIAAGTSMEIVIIRPPLVYGPGVKGNFNRMLHWVIKGIPFPFANVYNKRSFVSIDNLISLIKTCIHHPHAINQVFLVSDGKDLSTPELLKTVGQVFNKQTRFFPMPLAILKFLSELIGRKSEFERLCGSLRLDISDTCKRLDWRPDFKMTDTLKRMYNAPRNLDH